MLGSWRLIFPRRLLNSKTTARESLPQSLTASASSCMKKGCNSIFARNFFVFFCFSGIQGYLKHSSNKCVGVKEGKLVFKGSCTSAEQVFYKEKFSSKLVHVASGKCVADPSSDGTV